MNQENQDFVSWILAIDDKALSFWRDALVEYRHKLDMAWNKVKMFFFTVNAFFFVAILAFFREENQNIKVILVLSFVGALYNILCTVILRTDLKEYIAIQMRKMLIEYELGFYDIRLHGGVELPFTMPVEAMQDMLENPTEWEIKQRWKSGFARAWLALCLIFTAGYITIFCFTYLASKAASVSATIDAGHIPF